MNHQMFYTNVYSNLNYEDSWGIRFILENNMYKISIL